MKNFKLFILGSLFLFLCLSINITNAERTHEKELRFEHDKRYGCPGGDNGEKICEEALLFGPVTILREASKPQEVTYTFPRPPNFKDPFYLIIENGDSRSNAQVSSAFILLNGKVVVSPRDLNPKGKKVSKKIKLLENNTLTIRMHGKPGSFLKIYVTGQSSKSINPLDKFLEAGDLKLEGASVETFNALTTPLKFSLSGTEFLQDLAEVKLFINGNPVPSTNLTIEPNLITATSVLVDGKNDIAFSAVDIIGRPLYFNTTLWAGAQTIRVDIFDQYGSTLLEPVEVRASLSDDQSIFVQAETITGSIIFQNVPNRTILIQAAAGKNLFGFIGITGSQGYVQLRMMGINPPSSIDNNDFSLGTEGWNIGTAPVQILPHNEAVQSGDTPKGTSNQTENEKTIRPNQRDKGSIPISDLPPISQSLLDAGAKSIVDNDLILVTSGEGEQSISRAFNTKSGTTAVRIRYRFVTTEVPGGYFGSQYNDYFRVSLRSQKAGGFAGESNSMNGLGLAAFHYASGSTDWRNVILQVDKGGDVIQVDVGVANVGDGAYDSAVIIDFVEEVIDQVRPSITWNNIQGGINLSYLIVNGQLNQDMEINVYWANGTTYSNRLGNPIFTYNISAGTPEGSYGPIHINGNLLADDPAGVTHLIAASSETSVGSLTDVTVNYGANANAGAVWARTLDIIKDSLRAAGQRSATITSTTRSPGDQARAMFQNLVNPAFPVSTNVVNQLNLYSASGDMVINVFVQMTQGLTRQQILQNQTVIRAAMEQEINNQGPQNVSRHCGDPAQRNVVDIGASVFNANNIQLFINAIQRRVNYYLDERRNNGCIHIEVI